MSVHESKPADVPANIPVQEELVEVQTTTEAVQSLRRRAGSTTRSQRCSVGRKSRGTKNQEAPLAFAQDLELRVEAADSQREATRASRIVVGEDFHHRFGWP